MDTWIAIEEGRHYTIKDVQLLPYQFLRILGHGRSGFVEEAEDVRTGSVFALKRIGIPRHRSNIRRSLFKHEVRIIRSLSGHHHVIRVFATYVTKQEMVLVLQPAAEAGNLQNFLLDTMEEFDIKDEIPHWRSEILTRGFGCLVNALAFMHGHRICHHDIRPENILIHHGSVIYTDFGYSLNFNGIDDFSLDGVTHIFTRRRYAAPELVDYNPRDARHLDVFALGCVFVDMLAALTRKVVVDFRRRFFEDIDRVQRELEGARGSFPDSTAFVAKAAILMTQSDPSTRAKVSQISTVLHHFDDLSCERCQIMHRNSNLLAHVPARMTEQPKDHELAVNIPPAIRALSDTNIDITQASDRSTGISTSGWVWELPNRPTFHWGNVATSFSQATAGLGVGLSESSVITETPFPALAALHNWIPRESVMPERPALEWYGHIDPGYQMLTRPTKDQSLEAGKLILLCDKKARRVHHGKPRNVKLQSSISQVQHFIVVSRAENVIYACPVSSYAEKGTTKPGCRPAEHSIVHFSTQKPRYVSGEFGNGMSKMRIVVEPTHSLLTLSAASRICFGKTYSIDPSAEYRELGKVIPKHMKRLVVYWRKHFQRQISR